MLLFTTLYTHDIKTGTSDSLAQVYPDSKADDRGSIYATYFFRFSPDDKMIADSQAKNDSTFFDIRCLKDREVVFHSSKVCKIVDEGRKKDFTSDNIHIRNKDDRAGVILSNGKPRNAAYFVRLYPKTPDKEWQKLVSNLKFEE